MKTHVRPASERVPDPKHQPGCFLSLRGALYEVQCFEQVSLMVSRLWVRNAQTGYRSWLTPADTEAAVLVRAAADDWTLS